MTDLLRRPESQRASGGRPAGAPPGLRPLTTNALLAGGLAAALTLGLCLALALTGWFLADAGAHGRTTDALRVGADLWLLGNGTHLVLAGAPIGVVPTGLTLLLLVATFRAGRWAGASSAPLSRGEEQQAWALATTMLAGTYAVIAVIICVLASTDGATPSLGRAVVCPALLAFVGGGLGVAAGTGRLEAWQRALPAGVRNLLYGALTGALGLVAVAALVLAVSLLVHFNDAATVVSALRLSTGDAVAYAAVIALVAPNCVLLSASYLLGPGFAFGAGTSVTPAAVSLGAVPAFPVLAAVPGDGRSPGVLACLVAVPVLVAAVGAGLAAARSELRSWNAAALLGAGAGLGAGLLVTLAIALAGGPLGTGRLADIGAPVADVLLVALGGMGLGGMLGAVTVHWRARRAPADDPADDPTHDPTEDTARIFGDFDH